MQQPSRLLCKSAVIAGERRGTPRIIDRVGPQAPNATRDLDLKVKLSIIEGVEENREKGVETALMAGPSSNSSTCSRFRASSGIFQ